MTSLKASANRPSRAAESLRRKEENENGFQWPLKNGIGNANLEEGGGGGPSAKTQITVPVARSLASSGFTILLRLLLLLRMNFIVKRI